MGTGRCSWSPVSEGPHGPEAGGLAREGTQERLWWEQRLTEAVAGGPLSPGAPQPVGPTVPLGALTWAPGARVRRQGFHQPHTPASPGECNGEKSPGALGVREKLAGVTNF